MPCRAVPWLASLVDECRVEPLDGLLREHLGHDGGPVVGGVLAVAGHAAYGWGGKNGVGLGWVG